MIKIDSFNAKEIDVYARMTGPQLRNKLNPEDGIFIAESPTVIQIALDSGCEPISLLTEERLINSTVNKIIEKCESMGVPVYTAERDILKDITGFELTRGALCAMRRPKSKNIIELCKDAKRIAIFEAIADATNIGALFRSAAAFDIDAVLLTPTCCDPLSRRAVRVSMGTIFQIPWGVIGDTPSDWPLKGLEELKKIGFKSAAMALSDNSISIESEILFNEDRLAIILGTEGDGLSKTTIAQCDYTVKIPMSHNVDSLNVAAAGAVAFWQLSRRKPDEKTNLLNKT